MTLGGSKKRCRDFSEQVHDDRSSSRRCIGIRSASPGVEDYQYHPVQESADDIQDARNMSYLRNESDSPDSEIHTEAQGLCKLSPGKNHADRMTLLSRNDWACLENDLITPLRRSTSTIKLRHASPNPEDAKTERVCPYVAAPTSMLPLENCFRNNTATTEPLAGLKRSSVDFSQAPLGMQTLLSAACSSDSLCVCPSQSAEVTADADETRSRLPQRHNSYTTMPTEDWPDTDDYGSFGLDNMWSE